MVYFNFPKLHRFPGIKNCKIYCLQQLVQIQEYFCFNHMLLTDLLCSRVVRVELIEGSGLVHLAFFLRFLKMFPRISMDAIYIGNRLDSPIRLLIYYQ